MHAKLEIDGLVQFDGECITHSPPVEILESAQRVEARPTSATFAGRRIYLEVPRQYQGVPADEVLAKFNQHVAEGTVLFDSC